MDVTWLPDAEPRPLAERLGYLGHVLLRRRRERHRAGLEAHLVEVHAAFAEQRSALAEGYGAWSAATPTTCRP